MQKQSSPPKKIVFLTYHPIIGGGETALLSLLSKLDRKRFKATVIISEQGQLQKEIERLKIKTIILPLSGYLIRTFFIPGMSPTNIYKTYKIIKKIKPDLIHINHLNLAIYAGIPARILKIPTLATSHGNWDSIYFFQDQITNIFTDKILANTQQTANALKKRKIVRAEKIKTLHFGIDTNYFRPSDKDKSKKSFDLNPNDIIFTIVGRLDPVKDHLTFLKAAKIVNQKIKSAKFLIVGSRKGDFSGQNNAYQGQIKDFLKLNPELSDKVIFMGFQKNMPQIYRATDILISSSVSESFGLSLAEAAACAIPVISTNKGGQNNIVINGQNGYLISPKKPKILANKMIYLANNPKLCKRFGECGRAHIKSNFKLENYVQKIENTYLDLILKK